MASFKLKHLRRGFPANGLYLGCPLADARDLGRGKSKTPGPWDPGAREAEGALLVGGDLLGGDLEIARGDDVVSLEHAAGAMPTYRHRHLFGHARADHVANRRPAEIMHEPGDTRQAAA